MRNIEHGSQWPAYQALLRELTTNGCIDLHEPQWEDWIQPDKNGKKVNTLGPPLAHLSNPKSHNARVRLGLTVETTPNLAEGVVVRIGPGQYSFERNLEVRQRDTLVTDDPTIRRYNSKAWKFPDSEEEPPPHDGRSAARRSTPPPGFREWRLVTRTEVPPYWIMTDGETIVMLEETKRVPVNRQDT